MKRFLVFCLLLNAALLFSIWHEIFALAQGGGAGVVANEFECYDANGDGALDLADPVTLLNWLFLGTGTPEVCVAGSNGGLTPEQAEILGHMSIVELPVDNQGSIAKTVRFSGVNLQIVNGLGATNGNPANPSAIAPSVTTTNALGNLIVGYQETEQQFPTQRSGSHNLVVGTTHNYTSFGGLIGGTQNKVTGAYASVLGGFVNWGRGNASVVCGGFSNTASGESSVVAGGNSNETDSFAATVSGGSRNRAEGQASSVSGRSDNRASGQTSSVTGGSENWARGEHASVSGGFLNFASGRASSVTGGGGEELEDGLVRINDAVGDFSTITGGRFHRANGSYSVVVAGNANEANGEMSVVCGGAGNEANGAESCVSGGGQLNKANGFRSVVSGGFGNKAQADNSTVSGGVGHTTTFNGEHLP